MRTPFLESVFKSLVEFPRPDAYVRAKDVYDFFMGVPHDGSITVSGRQYSLTGREISEGMTAVFTLQRKDTSSPDAMRIDVLMCLFDSNELVRRLNNPHWIVRYARGISIDIRSEFDYQCRVRLYYEPNDIQDIYGSHNVNFFVDTFIEDFWNDIVERWPAREYRPISSKGIPTYVPDILAGQSGGDISINGGDGIINVVLPGARQVNQTGSVNIESGRDVTIGGDVVGDDKTTNDASPPDSTPDSHGGPQ